jgi:RNA polymerase sigma-70 factor (ECF subfamily)
VRNSEKELIRGLQAGDAQAVDEFVRCYGARVYDVHCWLCGDRTTAEDLTQETVLAVLRDIGKFRGEARLFTWVYQIARNLALRYVRRRGHETIPLEEITELVSPDDTELLAGRALLRDRVRAALKLLPVAQRESVVLHCLQGLSQVEVARALNRPLGTVKWQIAQGLHTLHDALLQVGVDPHEL